ncbi:hypothetical protein [Sediminicola luteus]|jgi:uncharacterized protein YoxC|uniref:Chromosome partitioning protein ParA n=1 Tax=Sediminicola luteus TaxID=319238 RepID=A0A2A4G4C4_9FLAO|nr:hypothetical protein [Sediminicola luteus]PCE62828.1 hypothetical protein B7P33_16240 [Sediminicola luteus]
MEDKQTKLNHRIVYAILAAIIVIILIVFYFNAASSANEIDYLTQQEKIFQKDITLLNAEVDRLSALNEVNEIEIQDSRYKVQQLYDSVGKLNFTISKLRQFKKELRILQVRHDSLMAKTRYLQNNNSLLAKQYGDTKQQIEELRDRSSSLSETEALLREKNKELSEELKVKNYLNLSYSLGSAYRLRTNGKPLKTSKANMVEKVRGCFTIKANPSVKKVQQKVVYFQILSPNMQIIEDEYTTVNVNGNTYSKKVEIVYDGGELEVCDFITVEKGSLTPGTYTLNVFEDERLLSSHEFVLK